MMNKPSNMLFQASLAVKKLIIRGGFFCILFIGSINYVNAQANLSSPTGTFRNFNPIPASPNVSAFQKYGDLPINYNTGIPQIEVPVYTISMKGFSWPVNLSYHASGFKSEDIASRVGLGWVIGGSGVISSKQSLIGGGVGVEASRTLNLDATTGTQQQGFQCIYSNQTDIDLADGIVNGTHYVSPDFYYINAGNINGKFLSGGAMLPASEIKIGAASIGSTADSVKWFVVDASGNKYEFGEIGTNYRGSWCQGQSNLQINPSYFLTKIKTVAGDSIVFTYDSESYTYSLPPLHIVKTVDGNQLTYCSSNYSGEDYNCQNQLTTIEKRLRTIESSTGAFLRFNYSSRNDLPGCTKIDSIAVQYRQGTDSTPIKSVKLFQSYFGSGTNPYDLQLKLDEVVYKGSDNSQESGYKFTYETSLSLPNKLSESITVNTGSNNGYYNITTAGILRKLQYPTGGYTKFDYEGLVGYGVLRIKEIADYDTLNQQTGYRRFVYGGTPPSYIEGVFTESETNKYFGNPANGGPLSSVNEGNYCSYIPFENLIVSCTRTIWKNQPIRNTLQDLMDASPRYGGVTEYFGNNDENGKIEYSYGGYDFGERPVDDISYLSDNLKEKKVYKKNSNSTFSLISETINKYEVPGCGLGLFDLPSGNSLEQRFWIKKVYRTQNEMSLCNICFPKEFLEANYRLASVPLYLKQSTQRDYNGSDSIVVTTKYFYQDSTHLSPTRTEAIDSKGDTIKTVYKYPHDFVGTAVYDAMVSRNMISSAIETSQYKNSTLLSKLKNNYQFWNANNSLIEQNSVEKSSYNNSLETEVSVNKYDAAGNVAQFTGKDGLPRTYIWDYKSTYPIAEIINADSTSVAYTSFEADGKGNWSFSGSPSSNSTSPTGKKAYTLNGSNNITRSNLTSGTTYVISYWTTNSSAYSITGTISGYPVAGRSVNGWKYFEHRITGQTSLAISGSGSIDELRLYPLNSFMSTSTYEPLTGLSSKADINNRIEYYEYDVFGRLKLVRDQDKNIIRRICYNYAGQVDNCHDGPITYYNSAATKDFTRNNCSTGYLPTTVTYTVPYGTYSSTTSQAYVDGLAQAQINTYGQSNANSNGSCLLIYYNVQKSGGFTRNNCDSGYTGSSVTYTVNASRYQSTISQAYVDALAQAEVDANGQAYVNSHGTCTPPCTTETCDAAGIGYKCVNGQCEYGTIVATNCWYDEFSGNWTITYHFEWSDSSWSDDYIMYSPQSWCF